MPLRDYKYPAGKGNIIVSDGSAAVNESFRKFFTEEGYGVYVCNDIEEFMALNHKDLRLVLIDVSASNRNAVHIVEIIKQSSVGCNIPVLVTGEVSDMEHIVAALNAGANDYILKPFTNAELLHRVVALSHRL